jgi:DNA-binding LacI/PurR family transcriptional regulator
MPGSSRLPVVTHRNRFTLNQRPPHQHEIERNGAQSHAQHEKESNSIGPWCVFSGHRFRSFSDLSVQTESYRKSGTAVVCVDRLPKDWDGDSVTADNETGAYNATNYVLRQGHTHFAMITGPRHLTNAQDRLKGFMRALADRKMHVGPEYIQEATFDQHGGYSKTMLLLRMIPRPTAIFAGNDLMAFGGLAALREARLHCPEDISNIGFDNLDLAEMMSPPLSSVSQPGYEIDTTAARILIDRVKGDDGPARHIVLETALTIRGSVVPPKPVG